MNTFAAMLRVSLRQQLQYRSAMLAGMVTQCLFALIYNMVYIAYYEYNPGAVLGMTLAQAVSYAWINEACLPMMTLSGLNDVEEMLRDGRIAFELTRPADLYGLWMARSVGKRLAPFFVNTPVLLLAARLMPADMRLLLEVRHLPLGVISMALAVLVCAAITVMMTTVCFYTVAGDGINRLLPFIATLCSGNLLPLEFYPEAVREVLRALPFAAVADAPMRILVGAAGTGEALCVIALQIFWLAALIALGRALMRSGIRRCMVQGG